jgi:hypothetical protein
MCCGTPGHRTLRPDVTQTAQKNSHLAQQQHGLHSAAVEHPRRRGGDGESRRPIVPLGSPEGLADGGVEEEIGEFCVRNRISLGHDFTSWLGLEPGGKLLLPLGSLL